MLAALVLEEIIDAVLFHQPAHEIEVGLTVLHAVFQLWTRALFGQLGFVIGEAAVVENLLDDIGRLLVLKYPAIGGPREQPQPRPKDEAIAVIVVLHAKPLRLDENAVELALLVVHL